MTPIAARAMARTSAVAIRAARTSCGRQSRSTISMASRSAPVILSGRPESGLAAHAAPVRWRTSVKAVAAYVRSVLASARRQGGPPPGPPVVLNIVVGDAAAGQAVLRREVQRVPFADRRSEGASRPACRMAMQLQNLWVSGGGAADEAAGAAVARDAGAQPAATSRSRDVTVIVTTAAGERVEGRLGPRRRLHRRRSPTPTACSAAFRRDGDVPKVEIRDPLGQHKKLLLDLHRQEHPRRDGISGDPEMTLKTTRSSQPSVVALPGAARRAGRRRPRSGVAPQAAGRFVADLFRRLHRPAIQRAEAGQSRRR